MTDVLSPVAPLEGRDYWSPVARRRWGIAFLAVMSVGVPVAVLVGEAHAWIALAFVSAPFWSRWVLWRASKTGVSETQWGLIWRATGQWHYAHPFRGEAAWPTIRSFEYIETLFGGERVVVTLVNGKRKDVSGARPTMRWRGGQTEDFVATLTDRARQFGAPIDDA